MARFVTRRALSVLVWAWVGVVLLGLGLTLQNPQRGPQDSTWERIQAQDEIIIGVDASIPPFGTINAEGALVGFDVAVGQALAQQLGVEARFVPLVFDGLYDSLLLGVVDVVIAALRPDPLRMDRVQYTPPYFDAGQVLVARQPRQTWSEVRGQTVAVEIASEGDLALRQHPSIIPLPRFSALDALQALTEGHAEAALVDRVSALLYEDGDLVVSSSPLVHDPYVMGVRREDWRLFNALGAALQTLEQDGTLQALQATWFTP